MIPVVRPYDGPELLRWHRCPDCEVSWRGADEECWSCGRMVPGTAASAPRITSQGGAATAMTETGWQAVRREIGVDPS